MAGRSVHGLAFEALRSPEGLVADKFPCSKRLQLGRRAHCSHGALVSPRHELGLGNWAHELQLRVAFDLPDSIMPHR